MSSVSIVFHNFSQFSLDIKVSHIHFFMIGFVTLVMKNSPRCQGNKLVHDNLLLSKKCEEL